MDKKELSTEYADSYRTGDVRPPKDRGGLITLLLLLVIFLGGLVSALSFLGIHLFQMLETKEDTSVQFIADMRLAEDNDPADSLEVDTLGVEGSFLTAFDRHYFKLPHGFYITQVYSSLSGLRRGDILLRINGASVTDASTLYGLLEVHGPGAVLSLDIYRGGKQQVVTVILELPNAR